MCDQEIGNLLPYHFGWLGSINYPTTFGVISGYLFEAFSSSFVKISNEPLIPILVAAALERTGNSDVAWGVQYKGKIRLEPVVDVPVEAFQKL